MSSMFSEEQSTINMLLAPAEYVLSYSIDELVSKKGKDQLIQLWQRIAQNYNNYVNNYANKVKPDIDREIRAKFDAALLLIAAALHKMGVQQPGITDYFSTEEIQHILSLEAFKNLSRVSIQSLVEGLKNNDQNVSGYVKLYKYYEENIQTFAQQNPRIANAYLVIYKRYASRIEEALAEFEKQKQIS